MENETVIRCSLWRWWTICRELKRRCQNIHESGAFLLGRRTGEIKRITSAVYYDDIDADALSTGIVRLRGSALSKVWQICREQNLEVIADVHTHPGGAAQSRSDQQYPMISTAGHTALIIPQFGRHPLSLSSVGVYRYRGSKQWWTCLPPRLRWFTVRF